MCLSLYIFPTTSSNMISHLSLHDALPIYEPCLTVDSMVEGALILNNGAQITSTPKTASARTFTILFQPKNKLDPEGFAAVASSRDRKSTRLNSSHRTISYAVFCLNKKKRT